MFRFRAPGQWHRMVDLREPKTVSATAPTDESVAELVQRASRQTADLMRQEMKLAQIELKQKGKRAGIGAGMFGAAGLIAFYGVAALIAAAVLGLAVVVEPWAAALIVGAALLVVAAVVAAVAKGKTDDALPPKPEKAMASIQDDVEHLKEQATR